MLTLLFMVLFAATFILFSDEMSVFLKKWYGVYWARFLVPLLVISWIWVWNDEFIPLLLAWSKEQVVLIVLKLAHVLPQSMQWIGSAAGLFFLASIPAWLLHLKFSRAVITKAQENLIARIYFFVWVFFAVMLLA